MSDAYQRFGAKAADVADPTVAVGRYACQRDAERLIVADVAKKLAIAPGDSLLEIGCGLGALLIPLAFQVHEAWGLDHPEVIRRLSERCQFPSGRLIGGNFLLIEKGDANCLTDYTRRNRKGKSTKCRSWAITFH